MLNVKLRAFLWGASFVWVLFSEFRTHSCSQHCFVSKSTPQYKILGAFKSLLWLCHLSVITVTESASLKFRTSSSVIPGDILRCLCGVMRFIDGILFYLHRQSESLTRVVLPACYVKDTSEYRHWSLGSALKTCALYKVSSQGCSLPLLDGGDPWALGLSKLLLSGISCGVISDSIWIILITEFTF